MTIAAHQRCYSHFLMESTRFQRALRATVSSRGSLLSGAAALERIAKLGGDPYGSRPESQRMVSFQAHLIAEPTDGSCVKCLERLPPDLAHLFSA